MVRVVFHLAAPAAAAPYAACRARRLPAQSSSVPHPSAYVTYHYTPMPNASLHQCAQRALPSAEATVAYGAQRFLLLCRIPQQSAGRKRQKRERETEKREGERQTS
jgi:hypothetical protein